MLPFDTSHQSLLKAAAEGVQPKKKTLPKGVSLEGAEAVETQRMMIQRAETSDRLKV